MGYGRGGGFDLGSLFALARAGTGLIAAPRIIHGEDVANQQDRMLLSQLGASPEQIEGLSPRPAITLPGGTVGKILQGVGTTGAILNSMFGGRIPAPRPDIGDIASVGQLMFTRGEKTRERDALEEAAALFKSPRASALARTGNMRAAVAADEPPGPKGSGLLAERIRSYVDGGLELDEARRRAIMDEKNDRFSNAYAGGRGSALGRFSVTSDPDYIESEADRAAATTGARLDTEYSPENVDRRADAARKTAEATSTVPPRPRAKGGEKTVDELAERFVGRTNPNTGLAYTPAEAYKVAEETVAEREKRREPAPPPAPDPLEARRQAIRQAVESGHMTPEAAARKLRQEGLAR